MFTTIRGRYHKGQLELDGLPPAQDSEVLVTFLSDSEIEISREELMEEFLKGMRKGYHLGGNYPKREEIYA